MKKILLLIIIGIVFLTGCANQNEEIIDNSIITENNINSQSTIQDFYGKPSIILFGGTYCPHCVSTMPIFKKEIYDVYRGKINVWINVIDNGKFEVDMPQGLNQQLEFTKITNKECNYIPSWVILDSKGIVQSSSCGGEKDLEEMLLVISKLQ